MLHKLVFALLAITVACTYAHTIDINPGERECFFEDLHRDDKMTVTYQVAGGGYFDINFDLTDPRGRSLFSQSKKDTGTYSFTATQDGRFEYCFNNDMSSVSTKTVSFNVHGIMYIDDDGHTAPIEKEIRDLSIALEAVRDEQEYIVVRERLHRNTAEKTNDRVKWWSIIQTLLLAVVCVSQVFYLRRFFEAKSAGRLM